MTWRLHGTSRKPTPRRSVSPWPRMPPRSRPGGPTWVAPGTSTSRRCEKAAEHDLKAAQRAADEFYAYASCVIDYTFAAVEEAEYAVLDATLAQMEADELAGVDAAES